MKTIVSNGDTSRISAPTAFLAIVAAALVVLLLAGLHILSPECVPSWRVASEYANGQYSRILSLMFVLWSISSWALTLAIWPRAKTAAGRIGLGFLIAAGVGQAIKPSDARWDVPINGHDEHESAALRHLRVLLHRAASLCTVSGEKAGTHTAMYSAPSASGVL